MLSFLVLGLSIATVIGVVIVAIRLLLKNKSKELSERIANITPYKDIRESREKELKQDNETFFIDIETDLRNSFYEHIISSSEEKQITKYYAELFHEACNLLKSLEVFHIEPSETISKFTRDFGHIHSFV